MAWESTIKTSFFKSPVIGLRTIAGDRNKESVVALWKCAQLAREFIAIQVRQTDINHAGVGHLLCG